MADKKISQLTAATLPLAGTEVLPIVQGGVTTKVATDDLTVKNFRSNASTGLLQVAGPGAGTTRVMTTPNANFTAARTDAAQTFSGNQTLNNNLFMPSGVVIVGETTAGMYIDVMNGTVDAQRVRVTTTGTDGLIVATRSGGTTPNLIFRIDATEYFRIGNSGNLTATNGNLVIGTAGKGIDFSATTHAAGMTSELLNDYEEGTWTPTVAGFGSPTYSVQNGKYTKVGNLVHITGKLSFSGASGASAVSIGGLPYASADANDLFQRASCFVEGDWAGAALFITSYGMFRANGTSLQGVKNSAGSSALALASDFSATVSFNFSLTYYV